MNFHVKSALAVLALVAIGLGIRPAKDQPALAAAAPLGAANPTTARAPSQTVAPPSEAQQQEAAQRIQEIAVREAELQARARAVSKTQEAQRRWKQQRFSAWGAMIASNQVLYAELRKKAATSADKLTTPCTICDGQGAFPCLMCEKHRRKCPECRGEGRLAGELCSVCIGDGKCFMCSGTGSMLCPFCDDGMVDLRVPPPTRTIPLD